MEFINKEKYKDNYGIYGIINKINGKVYVGQTGERFLRRYWHHQWKLRDNSHDNIYLQNAWNKYGGDNFEYVVLEVAEDLNETLEDTKESVEDLAKTKLDKLEQQYKDVLDTADKLNEKIEDNQEPLSELDEADMDKLRRSLESINDSTEDLDDRFSDLRKQIENKFKDRIEI